MSEKIPHYINDPIINARTAPELKLYRPAIHFWKAGLYFVIHIAIGAAAAFIWSFIENQSFSVLPDNLLSKILIAAAIAFIITLRFTLIWFVRVYQRYAKSETRLRCCMKPSCSEYAILALKKYGAIIGVIKTIGRLKRCHPPGGEDYP